MRPRCLLACALFALLAACTTELPSGRARDPGDHGDDVGEGEGDGEGEGEGEGGAAAEGEGEGEGDAAGEGEGEADCTSEAGLDLYRRRIEPLVSGAVPTTCNQCHMEGVDLSLYVQNSPCGTMACMLNQGVVVFDPPTASPVLTFILNSNPASNLITPDVIQQEHDGVLGWIDWSARCNDSVCGPAPSDPCGTGATDAPPPDVLSPLNGCDEAGLVQLFDQKVFSWRGRCVSCHATYGANTDPATGGAAPKMFYGSQESPEGPDDARFTMFNMIGLQVVNLTTPENSLLLHKPLNDLANNPHGGGQKFQDESDPAYADFLDWLTAYDACMADGADSPPAPVGNPPVVGILSPQNGATVPAGSVTFRCSTSDAEDGSPANVTWTSDLDGDLGTGCAPFTVSITSPRQFRTITATVTDRDGNVAIDRIAFGLQ